MPLKVLSVFLLLYFYASVAWGGGIKSQFNDFALDLDEEVEDFFFLLAGHIYGSHNESIYPSASLLANIQLLNNSEASFMVLLGDIIQRPNKLEIEMLKDSLLSRLNFPVFNAPGNHDLSNRQLYIEYFGKTFFSFQYSSSFFIFLDGEINNGKIKGDQLDFFIEVVEYCKKSQQIKNIFIFSHRLLWAIGNYPYSDIIPFVNGPDWHPDDATTISDIMLPKLKVLVNKDVYFVSGDIGCHWSLPLFYEKEPGSNITYIATGVGDTEKDLILKANVSKSGEVSFIPISLTRQNLSPVEYYGLDYWKGYFNKKVYKESLIKKVLRVIRGK